MWGCVFISCLPFACLVGWLGPICFWCYLGLAIALLCVDCFGGVGCCSACFSCVVGVCWLGMLVLAFWWFVFSYVFDSSLVGFLCCIGFFVCVFLAVLFGVWCFVVWFFSFCLCVIALHFWFYFYLFLSYEEFRAPFDLYIKKKKKMCCLVFVLFLSLHRSNQRCIAMW